MTQFSRPKLSDLRISGIAMPAASDRDVRVTLTPISAAADLRRTVNADLVNLARPVFQKYAISVSCADLWPAGVEGVMPGQYAEISPPARLSVSLLQASTSAQLPRAAYAVYGLAADGRKVSPIAQPENPRPLQPVFSAERVADLRVRPTVIFPEPVELIRFRTVFACLVLNWSTDADERQASASWSIQLEEV